VEMGCAQFCPRRLCVVLGEDLSDSTHTSKINCDLCLIEMRR
jgi:hypothetical protein